jgi:hypothetical protein
LFRKFRWAGRGLHQAVYSGMVWGSALLRGVIASWEGSVSSLSQHHPPRTVSSRGPPGGTDACTEKLSSDQASFLEVATFTWASSCFNICLLLYLKPAPFTRISSLAALGMTHTQRVSIAARKRIPEKEFIAEGYLMQQGYLLQQRRCVF